MKYKARLLTISAVTATFVIYLILFAHLSTYEDASGCNLQQNNTKNDALRSSNESRSVENIDTKQKDMDTPTFTKTVMYNDAVESLLDSIDNLQNFGYNRELLRREKFTDMALQLGRNSRVKSKLLFLWDSHEESEERDNNFIRFHHNIRAGALYDPEDRHIDGLLHDMATEKFETIDVIKEGTEFKLLLRYRKGGTKAVFKPMRWGREQETLPNHFYFNDYERHNAEIASFHLDRVLGFYRVPPVTGRFVSVTKELYPLADKRFKETFFVSPAGNNCFYGYCDYYCDSNHAFCGKGDLIEGSIMAWLPDGRDATRDRWFSPYRRTYSKFRKAEWEKDEGYCKKLMRKEPYLYKRFIGDFIDTNVFDFLTGNMDRHHVEVFRYLRNDSVAIHLDNGRGFGKANEDEFSILAPLRQCCRIRKSTFLKLAKLYVGPERLSELFDNSMKSDPVYPVVLPGYLNAVDRRIVHILKHVADCVEQERSVDAVIIDDPY